MASIRDELVVIYSKHNPSALNTLDETLQEWVGREGELLLQVREKYKVELEDGSGPDMAEITSKLKNVYRKHIRPIEEAYKFDVFFTPFLEDVDFDAKPMVLLLGQYSVGKTTFIKHLVRRDFAGMRIGPEPTTDKFVAVMEGRENKVIPGNALVVAADKPFRSLERFGGTFLDKFECSENDTSQGAAILKDVSFVDTPGVLSGEKQRIGRAYNYTGVVEWFADRSDRILLLFDAHKLDISDEFKRAIEALSRNTEKVRIVLNKSDSVNAQQLMRVYGALMWSLGKVFKSPEVLRVYIGSFWDKPLDTGHECFKLFENEAADLIGDLKALPRNSAIRKVNELVKRARLARVHAYIVSTLRSKLPVLYGKSKKQVKILDDLPNQFLAISKKYAIPESDFPSIQRFKGIIEQMDLSKFHKFSEKAMKKLDQAISVEIPAIMNMIPKARLKETIVEREEANPFSAGGEDWPITNEEKRRYDEMFQALSLNEMGKLGGAAAKEAFAESALANDVLYKVWSLSDVDKDNQLSRDEFALAKHLIERVKNGQSLPDVLPPRLVPPALR